MSDLGLNLTLSKFVGGLTLAAVLPLTGQSTARRGDVPQPSPSRGSGPSDMDHGTRSRPLGPPGERGVDARKAPGGSAVSAGSPSPSGSTNKGFAPHRYRGICHVMPTFHFWQNHDIMAEIQWMSRRGPVPVIPVDEEATELNGVADFPSGFKAYGFLVPPGGKLHVRLHHNNEGWFHLSMVNKWGGLGAGMLQNAIPTGNPEARYTNPSKETQAVYVIVDDPGWMSSAGYPYTLVVGRDWEPGKVDTKGVRMVEGIWAAHPVAGISAEFGRPHMRAAFGVGSRW